MKQLTLTSRKSFCGILFSAAMMLTAMPVSGQTFTEWHDLNVNEVNRYPVHTEVLPSTSEKISLEGTWKFKGVMNADERPTNFFNTNFDMYQILTKLKPGNTWSMCKPSTETVHTMWLTHAIADRTYACGRHLLKTLANGATRVLSSLITLTDNGTRCLRPTSSR